MDNKQDVQEFTIICKDCKARGVESKVNLHIDFKKKYYLFICYECGKTEAFNENNKRITGGKKETGGGGGVSPMGAN